MTVTKSAQKPGPFPFNRQGILAMSVIGIGVLVLGILLPSWFENLPANRAVRAHEVKQHRMIADKLIFECMHDRQQQCLGGFLIGADGKIFHVVGGSGQALTGHEFSLAELRTAWQVGTNLSRFDRFVMRNEEDWAHVRDQYLNQRIDQTFRN